jgi:CRP-like cAMP-binding protein
VDVLHLSVLPIPACTLTRSLDAGGREMLAKISPRLEFEPNSCIFRKSDKPAAMWIVSTGRVRVGTSSPFPSDVCHGQFIFGLTETIAGIGHRETLFADTFCTCNRVRREDLLEFLRENNGACLDVLQRLSQDHLAFVEKLAS